MASVSAPWFLSAQLELGTAFPTSGSAKLKAVNLEPTVALLSLDSVSRISRSLVGVYRDVFPPVVAILLVCLLLLWIRSQSRAREERRSAWQAAVAWVQADPSSALLVSYATVDVATTCVLLNPWFDGSTTASGPECRSAARVSFSRAALSPGASRRKPRAASRSHVSNKVSLRSPFGQSLAIGSILWTLFYRQVVPSPDPPYRG